MSYRDHIEELASLEAFEPRAFKGDDKVPQHVCSFVLALSLAFDDLRDVIQAHNLLSKVEPEEGPSVTQAWGQYSAHQTALMRLHAGLLHELFELVQENREAIEHDAITHIVNMMHPKARKSWNAILNVSLEHQPDSALASILARVRNKIVFHYDAQQIFTGFRECFLDGKGHDREASKQPLASRGDKVLRKRFYFADASVQHYLLKHADGDAMIELLGGQLNKDINNALTAVVEGFIEYRTGWCHREDISQESRSECRQQQESD